MCPTFDSAPEMEVTIQYENETLLYIFDIKLAHCHKTTSNFRKVEGSENINTSESMISCQGTE